MLIIEFAFAFVALVIMCCAFNERMTRDQSAITNAIRKTTATAAGDTILTDEEQFHSLIEKINAQICFGLFGFARQSCINAFETLASAKLNRKAVSANLYTDIRRLEVYVHELEFETEALPLYRKVKESLKRNLADNHVITQHVKVQTRQLYNLTQDAQPTMREALLGRNIRELVPLLVGEAVYNQGCQILAWTRKTRAATEPCYAVRTVRKR